MNNLKTFIKQSVKNFIEVGAILPSSSFLARRMIKNIKSPIILELGPGTGVFTKEILKKLPKDGILISIESNTEFYNHLKSKIKDSRLKLYNGDALLMNEFLQKNNINKVDCVISGLPLGHFKNEFRDKILNEISLSLNENGDYIQFQYILADIVGIKKIFSNIKISYELFNFPPAFVIMCKKSKK